MPNRRTMGEISKVHNQKLMIHVMGSLIYLQKVMNLSRACTEEAIEAMAEDVIEVGKHLSVEELQFFFNKFRRGEYGKSFQGLQSEHICEGLRKFTSDRADYFASKSLGDSNRNKSFLSSAPRSTTNEKPTNIVQGLIDQEIKRLERKS